MEKYICMGEKKEIKINGVKNKWKLKSKPPCRVGRPGLARYLYMGTVTVRS